MMQFMTHAVEIKPMYAHAKAHWESILINVAFPLMCFNDEDAALWEEDPHEYIRKVGGRGVWRGYILCRFEGCTRGHQGRGGASSHT